ncbi:MAG: hypothetical protein ABN478_08285, partial [Mixta sp.]
LPVTDKLPASCFLLPASCFLLPASCFLLPAFAMGIHLLLTATCPARYCALFMTLCFYSRVLIPLLKNAFAYSNNGFLQGDFIENILVLLIAEQNDGPAPAIVKNARKCRSAVRLIKLSLFLATYFSRKSIAK